MPSGVYKRTAEHLKLMREVGKKGYNSKTWFKKGHFDLVPKEKRGHSIATRLKMSKTRKGRFTGESSPYWIKDRTQIKSNKDRHWGSSEYTTWRTSVFERDGFRCRIGNVECESFVQAHHILSWKEYPELRYQTNNGITLCLAHHPRKRAEEKRLAPEFQKLVSVSK